MFSGRVRGPEVSQIFPIFAEIDQNFTNIKILPIAITNVCVVPSS